MKHKLDIGREVLLNFVQWLQRSRKCISHSEARVAILVFRSARKTQIGWRMLRSCFLSSFIELCSAVVEKAKMLANHLEAGRPSWFSDRPEKNTTLVEDVEFLLQLKVLSNSVLWFLWRSRDVSTNERPGWPSLFSNRREKHKPDKGC